MKIDQQIIEGAQRIRKKFLSIVSELSSNQEDLKKIADFLQKKMDDLKNIEKNEFNNKPTKEEIMRVSSIIVKEIEDIELQEQRLTKKFVKMNEELEKLQAEEKVIYDTLKSRYPNLSDDEIKSELSKYLDE